MFVGKEKDSQGGGIEDPRGRGSIHEVCESYQNISSACLLQRQRLSQVGSMFGAVLSQLSTHKATSKVREAVQSQAVAAYS